jgi:hypothetical protein
LHDVFAVDGSDEGLVQTLEGALHDFSSFFFSFGDLIGEAVYRGEAADQVVHVLGRRLGQMRKLLNLVVEFLVFRHDFKHRCPSA